MKRTLIALSAALLTTALATPLMAQPVPPVNTAYGEHHPNVETFDSYLDAHPEQRAELSKNPALIDNPRYVAHHPELQTFMHDHPDATHAFRRHPYAFEHREHVYNRSERRWDRRHHVPVDTH